MGCKRDVGEPPTYVWKALPHLQVLSLFLKQIWLEAIQIKGQFIPVNWGSLGKTILKSFYLFIILAIEKSIQTIKHPSALPYEKSVRSIYWPTVNTERKLCVFFSHFIYKTHTKSYFSKCSFKCTSNFSQFFFHQRQTSK